MRKTTVPVREPPRTLHWEPAEPDATRTTGAQERQGLTVTGGTGGKDKLHTHKMVCMLFKIRVSLPQELVLEM